LADDHRPGVTCQDVLDVELDGFGHAMDATDEVGNRTTAPLPSNPWQHAVVAWDLEHNIFAEQGSDDVGILSLAYSGEKLLRNVDVLSLARHVSPSSSGYSSIRHGSPNGALEPPRGAQRPRGRTPSGC
jgi:hypothetical protein